MDNNGNLVGELIRITTEDGLELQGLLFEPKIKATKVLIHVHGWVGNFYENKFIDNIAKEVIAKGLAFLTFNNRGAGVVQDFTKRENFKIKYVRIGGSLEKFEDSTIDIKAAVNFVDSRGYKQIVLQGHSLGCQKITFYQYMSSDKRIKGLILLAPVDDANFSRKKLGDKYQEAIITAKKLVEKDKQSFVPEWMAFYPMLTARMFLNVADPQSKSGRIFDYYGDMREIKKVECPVFVIFGSRDEYQDNVIDKLKILQENVKDCNTKVIENSNHGFVGYENILSQAIGQWLKQL